jgi:hypothetical protein
VVVLACCSRTAADVTTRLPKAAVNAATAFAVAAGSRRCRAAAACAGAIDVFSYS